MEHPINRIKIEASTLGEEFTLFTLEPKDTCLGNSTQGQVDEDIVNQFKAIGP